MLIHILEIDTGLQAHAIRLAAEHWGADVSVTWVGNARQVVEYFSTAPAHELLILAAHGDERGMLLPDIAAELRHLFPYHDVITPRDFGSFLASPLPIVVNLGCLGGAPALAEVFLQHGAPAYIGAVDYPEAPASTMYALEFVYNYLHNGNNVQAAHQEAAAHDDDRQQFQLYAAQPAST